MLIAEVFKDQATTQIFVENLLYSVAATSVIFIVLGLTLIDVGLARKKNVLDTVVQKIAASLIAGLGTFFFGYAIWNWQFYQAFGGSLSDSLRDWWLGGTAVTHYATQLDPAHFFAADVQQIFIVFFATFSMATLALIHSSVFERIKPLPLYCMAAVIGLITSPLAGYLCWGSASWLTNRGVHDIEGVFPLYIFSGTAALVLNWRLGPRLGALKPHPSGAAPAPQNQALAGMGVLLILFAIPLLVLGSGYIVPEVGWMGISLTSSGWGIAFTNVVLAYSAGALAGAVIAYKLKEWVWVALGPIAGVVIVGTMIDVSKPWVILIVALFGPPVALLTRRISFRYGIDDAKVVPLGLGCGAVGAIACGFIEWGTKTGGYFGGEGAYALQHAEITPWWQIIGVLAIVGLSGGTMLIMALVAERFGGLRVSEEIEIGGFDQHYWGTSNETVEPLGQPVLSTGTDDVRAPAERPLPA
jgi:Amt family ammonium transporter